MKDILVALAIASLAQMACTAAEPTPKDWLSKPTTGFTEQHKLPDTQFVEVRVTRLMTAAKRTHRCAGDTTDG